MAARDVTTGGPGESIGGVRRATRRLSTETKAFFKTSEFWVYIAIVAGILIAGNSIENQGGDDYFNASQVWLYITIVTLGYLLSRGIAKSGSRQPYDDDGDH